MVLNYDLCKTIYLVAFETKNFLKYKLSKFTQLAQVRNWKFVQLGKAGTFSSGEVSSLFAKSEAMIIATMNFKHYAGW